jgi:hypothetical protein
MEPDNDLFLGLWDIVKEYCPAAKRVELAERLLKMFEDFGVDSYEFKELLGEDYDLDCAVQSFLDSDEETEEEYDEDSEY